MDAYLICPETRKAIWLGKPIRTQRDAKAFRVLYYNQGPGDRNHEMPLLKRVLWKFLAEHDHKELRIVFSGEFSDEEYERIPTSDVEAEAYVRNWPPD